MGYFIDEKLAGVISFKLEQNEIDIHRLIVSPDYLRRGIAQEILDYVETHSKSSSIVVATASKNQPAITFYHKNGFKRTKEVEINPQLSLTSFRKSL